MRTYVVLKTHNQQDGTMRYITTVEANGAHQAITKARADADVAAEPVEQTYHAIPQRNITSITVRVETPEPVAKMTDGQLPIPGVPLAAVPEPVATEEDGA